MDANFLRPGLRGGRGRSSSRCRLCHSSYSRRYCSCNCTLRWVVVMVMLGEGTVPQRRVGTSRKAQEEWVRPTHEGEGCP